MGGAFFGFLSSKLEFITKAIFNRYYNILENKDFIFKHFIILGFLLLLYGKRL